LNHSHQRNRRSVDNLFLTDDGNSSNKNKFGSTTKNFTIDSNKTFKTNMAITVRGFGMSDLHSSNSLQNSVYSWSFGKADRFRTMYKKAASDVFYNLPKQTTDLYTTLGVGSRPDLKSDRGKDSPPPNIYKIKSSVDFNKQFGKGVLISERIKYPEPTGIKFPGPGTYKVQKDFWKEKQKNALKSRIMFFYDEDIQKKKHCISPQKYLPSTKLTENLRFTNVGFGFGLRSSCEIKSMRSNPGPGTYSSPSIFDKKRKMRVPLN